MELLCAETGGEEASVRCKVFVCEGCFGANSFCRINLQANVTHAHALPAHKNASFQSETTETVLPHIARILLRGIWPGGPKRARHAPTLCPAAPECSQARASPLQRTCAACQMNRLFG